MGRRPPPAPVPYGLRDDSLLIGGELAPSDELLLRKSKDRVLAISECAGQLFVWLAGKWSTN